MRRIVSLFFLFIFALPVGLSISGCKHAFSAAYCNSGDSGPQVGQLASLSLSPTLATTGISLNYGQIGQTLSVTGKDCKGNSASVGQVVYATSDMSFADINPSNGSVCAGTWNRNTGGGIANFTTCTPPATAPSNYLAYVTATADGVVSNAIPVYIHPTVTGIVLGPATVNCATSNDPGIDCCPPSTSGITVTGTPYTGGSCLSQNTTGQFIARVYANGNTLPSSNITCKVGPISYAAQNGGNIVTIDPNGVATAHEPGSTIITATIAQSSTGASAGFFSTCPPASISISANGQTSGVITDTLNTAVPLTATVIDTKGKALTGVALSYNSTDPISIPGGASVTPIFPSTATVTAYCAPGSCNPAPFSQISLFGNGQPLTSNGLTFSVAGSSSTILYIASTQSQYLSFYDFVTQQLGGPIKLQYPPTSMVITQDGSQIFMGSQQGLMTYTTGSNSATAANQSIPGSVLAVSNDGTQLLVSDASRQTVTLYTVGSNGATPKTSYGGIGVAARFTPDGNRVYVTTTTNTLLLYDSYYGWQPTTAGESYTDLAVAVPSVGAYFAGPSFTDGRSYCPSATSVNSASTPPTVTNNFAPLADENAAVMDRITATTDGNHIVGAHAAGTASTLTDLDVTIPVTSPCPKPGSTPAAVTPGFFTSTINGPLPLVGVNAAAITGVAANKASTLGFVTYTGSGGIVPYYNIPSSGTGTLGYLTLGNGATAASAPVAGVFSNDSLNFFVGTSGDNQVHVLTIKNNVPTETSVIAPALTPYTGTTLATPDLLVQHVKRLPGQ